MIHIDLFSGIGGFALAVDEVWDNVEHIFCEINPYCQTLLKKRFEGSVVYGDIRTLTKDSERKRRTHREHEKERVQIREQRKPGAGNEFGVHILTGGFPCQPFSQAGKRKGTADNRFLWPEMLRVIRDFKPTWVIAENVRGILTIEGGLVFEQVCLDLEGEGYEVQPFIIPAVAVNAPHRRDRVWFVAMHTASDGCRGAKTATDEKGYAEKSGQDRELERGFEGPHSHATDTERGSESGFNERQGQVQFRRSDWEQDWFTVATSFCRVDDGLSAELDGLKLSKAKHRVERLKALGNAIVPQCAIEIMKAISLTH